MPPNRKQILNALDRANQARIEISQLRQALRRGDQDLPDILMDPPPCTQNMTLVDLVTLSKHKYTNTYQLARLGKAAVSARVNLLMPMHRASLTSRKWLATYVRENPGLYKVRPYRAD